MVHVDVVPVGLPLEPWSCELGAEIGGYPGAPHTLPDSCGVASTL